MTLEKGILLKFYYQSERGIPVDWQEVKTEYVTTDTSYRKLAKKYGVSATAVANKAKAENWVSLREQFLSDSFTKTVKKIKQKESDRMSRIMAASDKLLEKIERAIDELDIQMVTYKEKTKVIEYNNYKRPDKPTKEVIEEKEELIETKSIIDRMGLQKVAASLLALKEIQDLKSEADIREQEARIAKLEKEAEDEDKTSEVEIIIQGGDTSWQE